MNLQGLRTWEIMLKKIAWQQLGATAGKKILDFGSGLGITADYLAKNNDVTAVELSADRIANRSHDNPYEQHCGSTLAHSSNCTTAHIV